MATLFCPKRSVGIRSVGPSRRRRRAELAKPRAPPSNSSLSAVSPFPSSKIRIGHDPSRRGGLRMVPHPRILPRWPTTSRIFPSSMASTSRGFASRERSNGSTSMRPCGMRQRDGARRSRLCATPWPYAARWEPTWRRCATYTERDGRRRSSGRGSASSEDTSMRTGCPVCSRMSSQLLTYAWFARAVGLDELAAALSAEGILAAPPMPLPGDGRAFAWFLLDAGGGPSGRARRV
jgi:hypothetical protein